MFGRWRHASWGCSDYNRPELRDLKLNSAAEEAARQWMTHLSHCTKTPRLPFIFTWAASGWWCQDAYERCLTRVTKIRDKNYLHLFKRSSSKKKRLQSQNQVKSSFFRTPSFDLAGYFGWLSSCRINSNPTRCLRDGHWMMIRVKECKVFHRWWEHLQSLIQKIRMAFSWYQKPLVEKLMRVCKFYIFPQG